MTIGPVYTPPTNEPIDTVNIASFSASGDPYDEGSVIVVGVTEKSFSSLSVTTLSTPYTNSEVGLRIRATLSSTIDSSSDTLYLDLTNGQYSPSLNFDRLSWTGSNVFAVIDST